MPNLLLEAALSYAARGWPVLPLHTWVGRCSCGDGQCSSPAKHPRTPHGLQDASTDPAVLEEWWRRWPDSNVGVRCDLLCVLDLDGPGAAIALGEHDLDPDLHGCTTQTGVGRHLLFQAHPAARPRTKVLPDVDVRAGSGSYIVAPPSMHWTGAVYEWKQEGDPPPLPAAIMAVLGLAEPGPRSEQVRDPGPPAAVATNGAHPVAPERGGGVAAALAEARDRGLLGVGEGGRHDTLLRLVGRQLAIGLMDLPELLAWALTWASSCTPPYPREQALRDAHDVWQRHAAQHGGDPTFDYGEGAMAAPAAVSLPPWMTAERWLGEQPPAVRWLLRHPDRDGRPCAPRDGDGMLGRGRAGILAAEGGAGKTTALVQLGMALLTGRPWFGHFHTPAPWGPERGRVCLLLAESKEEDAWRSVYDLAAALKLDEAERAAVGRDLVVWPLAGKTMHLLRQVGSGSEALETREFQALRAQLQAEAGDKGWSLIGMDPLIRIAGIDAEGDNTMATRLVQAVESMTEVPGEPSVLTLAHSSKLARRLGEADSRGVTGLTDGMRWHGTMVVKGDRIEFRQRKSNHSRPMADPVLLRRERGGLLVAVPPEVGETVTAALTGGIARVVQTLQAMGGRAASLNSLAGSIGGKRSVASGWIAEAADRGLILVVRGPNRSMGFTLPDPGITGPEKGP